MSTEWIPVSDPPKKPGWYLVDNPQWSNAMASDWDGKEWTFGYVNPTHWRELPPRAPKPDAFDEWWEGQPNAGPAYRIICGCYMNCSQAKFIWDAAMKAKEQGK